jgi:hypothetical protein
MNSTKLRNTLALIVGLLSQRAFDELYRLDRTKRLLPNDLARALDDYGGQVTLPPSPAWDYHFIPLDESDDVHVDCDLWINGQRSDLTVQCEVHDEEMDGRYAFSIDDLRVM